MKKTRNILFTTLIMLLAMSTGLMAQTTAVQPPLEDPGSAYNASTNPYVVSTLGHLSWLAQNSSGWWDKAYKQTANITATQTQYWDDADDNSDGDLYNDTNDGSDTGNDDGFSPIGIYSSPAFTGSYDGQNHTIDNLFINRPSTGFIGLFGYTSGATIENLGLTSASITGQSYIGALVGYNYSGSTITNCYATGCTILSTNSSASALGGLVGNNRSTISYCYTTGGSVTANGASAWAVGGLLGINYSGSTVEYCYSSCSATVGGQQGGGLVGRNALNGPATISNSYASGNVSGGSTNHGGLIGYHQSGGTVTNCYSTGSVTSGDNIGGFCGTGSGGTVNNCFWDTETSLNAVSGGGTGKTTAEMKTQSTFTNWNFSTIWEIVGGDGANYPRLINNPDASLPVELTSFTADNSRAGEITLNWITESEIENLGFLLDRRPETGEWTEIASYITDEALRGQGSVTYRTVYTYTDKSVEPGVTYDYRLADVSYAGEKVYHALNVLGVAVTEIPEEFALFPAYPNPFNPATTISYHLIEDGNVTITIFNINGRKVTRLVDKAQNAGKYKLYWDASGVSVGVYFCKLTQGNHTATQKLIFLK